MPTTLPPSTDYTGAAVTQGGKKTFVAAMRTFLADLLGTTGAAADARTALGIKQILPITASVASNALTATINPCPLDFRSNPLTSGAVVQREVASAVSVVVPSGATLGTVSAVQSRVLLLAIDNAGTVESAVVNVSGGNNLDETTLISTTAISAAADSANVIYSTTARTNVAFRIVGYIESTQATAGTWATAPSTIQGCGGQALAAMNSLGHGQTWQSVLGSRALATTYYNTTGKPIMVFASADIVTLGNNLTMTINGTAAISGIPCSQANFPSTVTGIVPPGQSYVINGTGTPTLTAWRELR